MAPRQNHIAVSGAGPAGLAAAITAARGGARAVVYERHKAVGHRFHGDFQGLENWTADEDVLEELAALGIEPTFECTPFYEVVLFDPDGREYLCRDARPLFYLVRRGAGENSLDQGLAAQARSLGIELRFDTPCHHLPEGGIVAEGPRRADVIAVGFQFETDFRCRPPRARVVCSTSANVPDFRMPWQDSGCVMLCCPASWPPQPCWRAGPRRTMGCGALDSRARCARRQSIDSFMPPSVMWVAGPSPGGSAAGLEAARASGAATRTRL